MKWNLNAEDGVRIKSIGKKKKSYIHFGWGIYKQKYLDAEFVYIVDQDFLEWK